MLEVILDTETTGLSTTEKHRIAEIGCIELNNQIPTNKIFHKHINPERSVSEDAYKIHGYSNKFLSDKKIFSEITEDFLNFIKDKKIIIHNAPFDLGFINYELRLLKKNEIKKENVIDTLEIARSKFSGSQNSLDALCKRFNIDLSKRVKHNALLDCELLREVYINLIGVKEPKLIFSETEDVKNISVVSRSINYHKKVIKLSDQEILRHKDFLKKELKKNFY